MQDKQTDDTYYFIIGILIIFFIGYFLVSWVSGSKVRKYIQNQEYEKAIEYYEKKGGHEDDIERMYELIDERDGKIYQQALELYADEQYEEACQLFESIDYRDSGKMFEKCLEKLDELYE